MIQSASQQPTGDNKQCSVQGCTALNPKRLKRGMCPGHYHRWYRTGNTGSPTIKPLNHNKPRNHGCKATDCDSTHYAKGYCTRHYTQAHKWGVVDQPDRRLSGHNITYTGMHKRIKDKRGKASQHQCINCDNQANEWAYNHQDPNQLTETRGGKTKPYSPDHSFYDPMCKRCHTKRDRGI